MLLGDLKETFLTSIVVGLLLMNLIRVPLIVLVVIVISMLLIKIVDWLVVTHRIIIDWLHDFLLLCLTCKATKRVIWINNLFDRL